jgi:hypothetical protein
MTARRRKFTAVGRPTPAMIFISVDFPAPFPPISACTWPASSVKSIPSARHAGELFADLASFKQWCHHRAAIEQMIFKLIMFKSVDGELYLQPCRDHSFIALDPENQKQSKDPFCQSAHTFRPRNHEHMI